MGEVIIFKNKILSFDSFSFNLKNTSVINIQQKEILKCIQVWHLHAILWFKIDYVSVEVIELLLFLLVLVKLNYFYSQFPSKNVKIIVLEVLRFNHNVLQAIVSTF